MSAKGSELKRVRQSRKANLINKSYKSKISTAVKNVLNENKKDLAEKKLNEAVKLIDKVASKGIIHKNKAANKKSNLYKHLTSLLIYVKIRISIIRRIFRDINIVRMTFYYSRRSYLYKLCFIFYLRYIF